MSDFAYRMLEAYLLGQYIVGCITIVVLLLLLFIKLTIRLKIRKTYGHRKK